MPDTKRQKIISAIVARMETIRTANGYQTEIGAHVDDWRTNWPTEQMPALSVCDTVEEVEFIGQQPTASRQMRTLPVMLRVFVSGEERAADLRRCCSSCSCRSPSGRP